VLVALALAFGTLTLAPVTALAEGEPDLPPPDPNYVPTGTEFYESTQGISSDSGCKDICPNAAVTDGSSTVYVTRQMLADDKGFHEYVKGAVGGSTNAPSSRVLRMQIGGVLLRADNCGELFTKGTQMEGGDVVVSYTTSGFRGWTAWYHGWNDCWDQTGHNDFRIQTSTGVWDYWVVGDLIKKF